MWPFRKAKRNHQITFREFLVEHGIVPGKEIAFSKEERQAIGRGWAEFAAISNAGAAEGQRLCGAPEVLRPLEEASASSALQSLALRLLVDAAPSSLRSPDKTARRRACSAAAKSVALDATPLHFYLVAGIFEQAEEIAFASCLYREFLARWEQVPRPSSDQKRLEIEQRAVQHAKEFLMSRAAA